MYILRRDMQSSTGRDLCPVIGNAHSDCGDQGQDLDQGEARMWMDQLEIRLGVENLINIHTIDHCSIVWMC